MQSNHCSKILLSKILKFIQTSIKTQTKHNLDTAMLVRGQDDYRHFDYDRPATSDLDPAAIAHQALLENRYVSIAGKQ